VAGLLSQTTRKNVERINEKTGTCSYEEMQYLISEALWSHEDLIADIALHGNNLIGGHPDTCLLIDESPNSKKGQASVGVARQWNGRLGKIDNCQVGVHAVLSGRAAVCPVDVRLYLPECWTSDPARLDKAGVPEEHRRFRTKIELAEEMIFAARSRGLGFQWVGFDEAYGRSRDLLTRLDDAGIIFVGDVPSNTLVSVPGQETAIRVDELAATLDWNKVRVRDSTKGVINLAVACTGVDLSIAKEKETSRHWTLVVTRPVDGGEMKFSLSNADQSTSPDRLAYMQRQRFWVERCFEDAKSTCGMSQYQVRKWSGWHHHMALVMLAMLFLLEERTRNMDEVPLLSCADIIGLLDSYFCTRDGNALIEQLKVRHRQRTRDIVNAYRRQRTKTSDSPTGEFNEVELA